MQYRSRNRILAYLYYVNILCIGASQICCGNKNQAQTIDEGLYTNPIIAGFNPDPSICRVGDDYYLVNSSFSYYPGIPIMHSRDLVHWTQIGSAIDRPEQIDFTNQGMSRGLFAPVITFHEGWYYFLCTLVDNGGNFIVKSQYPGGPYSLPNWLPEVNGIDPSLFVDSDGRFYIIYNSDPPENKALYGGHRTIRMFELDKSTLKVKGKQLILVNGGTDLAKKPVWIEGPHIYKIKNNYFLMCAEGGTAEDHSEVIFKSEAVTGPYVAWEKNPILTQRNLDSSRVNPITCTGHADIVQIQDSSWWAVFLGCRPYSDNHYNLGRETFLAPVTWDSGWPVITQGEELVMYNYPKPQTRQVDFSTTPLNGNYTIRETFELPLDRRWLMLRNPKTKWLHHEERLGQLEIDLLPVVIADKENPALFAKRQPHIFGHVQTHIDFSPENESEQAGLVILQNESHHYFVNKKKDKLQLLKKNDKNGYDVLNEVDYKNKGVHIKVESAGPVYHFYYSEDGDEFLTLAKDVDATYLSTKTAGGFIGVMYGLYGTSNGKASSNKLIVDYFEIKTDEPPHQ